MTNELNEKITSLFKNFDDRKTSMNNEIERLKITANAITESHAEHFEKVYDFIKSELPEIIDAISSIKSHEDCSCVGSDWHEVCTTSAYSGHSICRYFKIYFDRNNRELFIRYTRYSNYSCTQTLNICSLGTLTSDEKQCYAKYFEEFFEEDVLKIIEKRIENNLEVVQKELERLSNVVKNAVPVETKVDSHWNEYILYLVKWSADHLDSSFSGMSPACYNEWLDNEFGDN